MNINTCIFFSTLVFGLSLYAATEERSEIKGSVAPTSFTESVDDFKITNSPSIPDRSIPKPAFTYTASKSLYFRMGQYSFWQKSKTYHPVGLTFSDYSRNMDAKEYGFDLKADLGRLFYGKKYYFNIVGATRMFYKWNLGLNLDPDDGLANLVDFKKYMLGLGLGAEASFTIRSGLRIDGDIFRSRDDTIVQALVGYVYSW